MSDGTCAFCGDNFQRRSSVQTYCSPRCREARKWAARPRVPCSVCGGPSGWAVGGRRAIPDVVWCLACKRASINHGTATGYKKGCRCDDCRAAKAAELRRYAAAFREREGYWPRRNYPSTGAPVPRRVRHEIYERDGWVCQICLAPVDPDLPGSHRMAATLDHIECQSWALIPDHSPQNLRLAHRACNSQRGNRVA